MHLSSGHVNLMPGKFYLPPNFPQSDLGRRADSRWALPQISSFYFFSQQSQAFTKETNINYKLLCRLAKLVKDVIKIACPSMIYDVLLLRI